MSPYQIHGLLQSIVFLVLFPLGASIALFRRIIGSRWRVMHVSIQLTAITLFMIAISIAYYMGNIKNKNTKKHDRQINKLHRYMGRFIFVVIVLQLFWAYQGRKIVSWKVWYYIHMLLSSIIIFSGITNIFIARKMMSKSYTDENKETIKNDEEIVSE
jgi:cytochrome b561